MVWGGVLLMSFVVLGTSGTLGAVEEGPDEECSSHTQPESEAPETANHSAPIPVEVRPAPVSSREADAEPQGCPVQPEPEELPSGEEWEEEQGDRSAEVFLELSQRHPPPSGLLGGIMTRLSSGPSSEERRVGVERLTCDLACSCGSGTEQWPCLVTNIGVGGLELVLQHEPDRRTRLWICPEGEQEFVTGRIVWTKAVDDGFRVGYEFDQSTEALSGSWVARELFELGAEFLLQRAPRRFVRVPTEIGSRLVLKSGDFIDVTLRDVSLGGCLLQSEERLDVPQITLGLGGVTCNGSIVNSRLSDEGWMHHIRFQPLRRFEKARLRRSIRRLLLANENS